MTLIVNILSTGWTLNDTLHAVLSNFSVYVRYYMQCKNPMFIDAVLGKKADIYQVCLNTQVL